MPDRFRLVYRFPLPPSGNTSVRTGRGHQYTPAWIVDFRDAVYAARCSQEANLARMRPAITTHVGVVLWLPRFRGDIDNRLKTLFDAITKARIWKDDRLIKQKHVGIDLAMPKDRCVVVICDLETFWREVGQLAQRQAELTA